MITRYFLPILALIGIIFGVRTVVLGSKSPTPAAPVVEPSHSPFSAAVAGAGIVEASSENIAIATPTGGVVTHVFVAVGDRVSAGDALFKLDDRELRADLLVQNGGLAVAKARLADARNQYAMYQAVADQRAVSTDELTRRKFGVTVAEATVLQAESLVQASETKLERLTVRAPIGGRLLQVKVRVGEFAPAQAMSAPLMLLGDVDQLRVRVDVDENDAWRITSGAPAKGFMRGNQAFSFALQFEKFEPYIVPKRSLTGESSERVDTRVLQVLYRFDPSTLPVFVGQLVDVFIESKSNYQNKPASPLAPFGEIQ